MSSRVDGVWGGGGGGGGRSLAGIQASPEEAAEIEPTTHVTLRSCSNGLRLQHSITLVKIAVYELNSLVERVGLILI